MQLDERLDQWERAGLIDADQLRRIREFEAASSAPEAVDGGAPRRSGDTPARPSGTELLAYLGVLIALAGVVTLVYASGATLSLIAALTLVIGLVALAATWEFARRGTAPSARAAGACLALGAVAIGTAVSELATAALLFTRTTSIEINCVPSSACPAYTSTDQSGNVLAGACVVVAIALAVLRFVPGRMAAIVAVVAGYVGAAAAIDVSGLHVEQSPAPIALVLLAVSALLIGNGETVQTRQPDVSNFLGFAGVIGATIPLYLIGGRSDVHLDILAGIIATVALALGISIPRAGLAYGAVIGLAGLVVDIGARNFSTPTALGVFFSVSGVTAVVALIATTRLLRTRRVAQQGQVRE
jgi:hypothetical protein